MFYKYTINNNKFFSSYKYLTIIKDAWFLASTAITGEASGEKDLRMIYPNHWGAINNQKVIVDEDDIQNLLSETTDEILR